MSFSPYERYNHHGAGWLSSVPEHWSVVPNKAVLKDKNILVGENAADYTLLSLTLGGVVTRDVDSGKGKFPAEFNLYKLVQSGDLVLCLFDMDETPRTVGLAPKSGMITGAYEVFEVTSDADAAFLYYFYLHVDKYKGLRPWYTGLRKVVRPDTFRSIKIGLPPIAEQKAIASFLDQETAKIDSLIQEQRRLIELLKEKRQAVISQLVTKGLNPKAPRKNSGDLVIGEIPANWEMVPNGRLMRERSALVGTRAHEFTLLSLTLRGVIVRDTESNQGKYPASFDSYKEVTPDELVFCLFDIDETPRTVGLAYHHGMITGAYDVYRCGSDLNPEYAHYYYLSRDFEKTLRPHYTGLRKVIRPDTFKSILMPVPPRREQDAIVGCLKDLLEGLAQLRSEVEESLLILHERRAALISAAVTGKIDVRKYVPHETPAPEEVYELA